MADSKGKYTLRDQPTMIHGSLTTVIISFLRLLLITIFILIFYSNYRGCFDEDLGKMCRSI